MDGALYFPLSKYGIEVRFRGSTRGEENQENKDHFICVFPLQLDKDILIHTCISQWFREFTQLVVFIFCYISYAQGANIIKGRVKNIIYIDSKGWGRETLPSKFVVLVRS